MELLQSAVRCTVVIPTYNRKEQLWSCLTALADSAPEGTEVIVVSDGGDRAAFPDLTQLSAKLDLTVIHAQHGGPAHARNIGLQAAKAPVVAFIDDDCLPRPGWLESLARHVGIDPPVAAGGTSRNGLPGNIFAETAQLILDIGERDQRQRGYGTIFCASNNIAFPAEALRRIGGFDPAFITAEDRELCRRWLQAGFGLVKAPEAVAEHLPVMDLRGFWNKFVAYGTGAARFHDSAEEDWQRDSLAFHVRVPALAAAELSEKNIKPRWPIFMLLLVWECANAVGYFQQKWKNRHQPETHGTAGDSDG